MARTLILGGTAWLGRAVAAHALSLGQEVTCLARGTAGAVPDGVTLIPADRSLPDAYDQVKTTDWDEVIEIAWAPDLVDSALTALADRAAHWTLVSSVSVYATNQTSGAAEDDELAAPEPNPADYAAAKSYAESQTLAALADRLLIARPGLIIGAGDGSDRFGYWAAALARQVQRPEGAPTAEARILTPTLDRLVQMIDVEDLAAWLAAAAAAHTLGPVNAVGPVVPFGDVLTDLAKAAGYEGALSEAQDNWLESHGVNYWAGPRSLPLWLPASELAMLTRSGERYLATGGTHASLTEIAESVVADELRRGITRDRRAGLTESEEADLLASLQGS